MNIGLVMDKIRDVKATFLASVAQEETMEAIVPDSLPDILRIVDADAIAFMRGKSTDAGRVTVSGVAAFTVLYCPENADGVRKLEFEVPFSVSAADTSVTPNSRAVAKVRVTSADASIINSRKIVARVGLLADIACHNDAEIQVASGVENGQEAGIEALVESCDITVSSGVREKTFVISDELGLPASNPPIGEILKYSVSISPDDTKAVGSKLILRGVAQVSIMYGAAGREVAKADFSTEFSQIIEVDNVAGESSFQVTLMPTNAYFDASQSPQNADGRAVLMEIHAVAQCVGFEKKRLTYISDAYSTRYQIEQSSAEHTFESRSQSHSSSLFHTLLETPTPVSRVLGLSVHAGAVTVSEQQRGLLQLKCPISVNAVYIGDDGQIHSAARQYEAESSAGASDGSAFAAEAACLVRDVYAAPAGGGIELRIPVDFTVTESTPRRIRTIEALSCDESSPLDTSKSPSLVACRVTRGDTLWALAKKHRSTARLIMAANALEREDGLAPGQLILIPKKK